MICSVPLISTGDPITRYSQYHSSSAQSLFYLCSTTIRKNGAASIRYARLSKEPSTILRSTCALPGGIQEIIWPQKRMSFLPGLPASSPLLLHIGCIIRNIYGAWNLSLIAWKVFCYHSTKYIFRAFLCPKSSFICHPGLTAGIWPCFVLLTYGQLRCSIANQFI